MELYFLRHAIAVEQETEGYADQERPLTSEGKKKMVEAVRGMKELKIKIDVLLSSPLTRALQTAELVRENLPFEGEIEVEKTLAPGGSYEDFLKKLRTREDSSVMLVGHEPALSSWVQNLLGCDPTGSVLMKKGSLCHLSLHWRGSRPFAELESLLQPRMLRQIG